MRRLSLRHGWSDQSRHTAEEIGCHSDCNAQPAAEVTDYARMITRTEVGEQPIIVHVTRYEVARIRWAQALIPLVVISSIVARRNLEAVPLAIAGSLQLVTLVTFISARRGLGWQQLRIARGAASFGADLEIARHRVRSWTVAGGLARLYCGDISLRLRARNPDAAALVQQLDGWLGAPLRLTRRGSKRARMFSLGIAVVGLLLVGLAFAYSMVALVVVGLPCFILGIAAFGAFSQRVART